MVRVARGHATRTVDKYRALQPRKKPKNWPGADFGFGDKRHRHHTAERHYIQPGRMIG